MFVLRRFAGRSAVAALLVAISACGGTGSEADPPRSDPPPSGAEFTLRGSISSDDIGFAANLTFWAYSKFDGSSSAVGYLASYDRSASSGDFSVDLDSDDLPTVTVNDFAGWLLRDSEEPSLEVDNPAATIGVFESMRLIQIDPASYDSLQSHSHQFVNAPDTPGALPMYLVFSTEAAEVKADAGFRKLDLKLETGWNFVYAEFPEVDGGGPVMLHQSRPATADTRLTPLGSNMEAATGEVEPGEVGGVAFYAGHSPDQASAETMLSDVRIGTSATTVRSLLPSWFPESSAISLHALPAALGVLSGTVDSDENDARFVMATGLAFDVDDSHSSDGWWQAVEAASSVIRLENAEGNTVIYLYADRSAVVHLDEAGLPAVPGAKVSSAAEGVPLVMGWNRIALVPAEGESSYTATRITAVPEMEFVPLVVQPEPPVIDNAPEFQAAVGTANTDEGVWTHFRVRAMSPGERVDVTFTVTGPAGWNDDQPWTDTRFTGANWLLEAQTTAVSGMYSFSTMIDGVIYTDSMVLDADQLLGQVDEVRITERSWNRIAAEWDPVDGVHEYWVNLMEAGTGEYMGFMVVRQRGSSVSVEFTDVALISGRQYELWVYAYSPAPPQTPDEFILQVDSSLSISEPFEIPFVQGAVGTYLYDETVFMNLVVGLGD